MLSKVLVVHFGAVCFSKVVPGPSFQDFRGRQCQASLRCLVHPWMLELFARARL